MSQLFKYGFCCALIACTFSQSITTANAASQDECSIWLCLPGGFPNGCSAAKSAMKDRVKKGKSPLPSFSSCSVDGSAGGMSSNDGRAAEIRNGQSWVKNTTCRYHRGERTPQGCTDSGWYAEVFINGTQQGNTYFFTP
ncbi:hypothetical protein D3C85_1050310 [compost metagenome]